MNIEMSIIIGCHCHFLDEDKIFSTTIYFSDLYYDIIIYIYVQMQVFWLALSVIISSQCIFCSSQCIADSYLHMVTAWL